MTDAAPPARLASLDIARSAALAGMVAFHLVYDLSMFGHVAPEVPFSGWWWVHARAVAASFLFLAGVSLVLAHGQGIRWGAFGRRLLRVAGAAALVSAATWWAFGDRFIFFGILHSIAASSLIGLALLRMAPPVLALMAGAVVALPMAWQSPVFDTAWLAWIGFAETIPDTADFEPLFPWTGAFIAGMAAGRAFGAALPVLPDTRLVRALAWPGRHSLAIYLIHQPLLIGVIFLATFGLPRF